MGWCDQGTLSVHDPGATIDPSASQPDITFFGEQLADDFDNLLYQDREEVDLLIVIGTSLKVRRHANANSSECGS